ncbi:MAG: hypothetical protein GC191_08065 [Azospirillum sp.]|nr:hypothetical protein [Azospirillum sp.]
MKTASWFTPLTAEYLRIGISRGVPRRQPAGYRLFKTLAPGAWFNTVGVEEYRQRYWAEVLDRLDPTRVVAELAALAAGAEPVIVCYEQIGKPGWCHRAMVSAWLADTLALSVPELGHEQAGHGWHHPLMPPELRRGS